jgi:hypothetical protein
MFIYRVLEVLKSPIARMLFYLVNFLHMYRTSIAGLALEEVNVRVERGVLYRSAWHSPQTHPTGPWPSLKRWYASMYSG